jgi:aminoglycoside phosphotransferase (APT) family kinase protein
LQRVWQPEIVVDEELARELIRGQFPNISVEKIQSLGAGWDNTAFLVDDAYVFRFPRRQIAVPLLERESKALPMIAAKTSVTAVPSPCYFGKPSEQFGWPFAGYRFLPGRTACSYSLTETERSALAVPLAKFLRELHSIEVSTARTAGVAEDTMGKLSLEKWIPRLRQHLTSFRERGIDMEYTALQNIIDSLQSRLPKLGAPHLVHGDFYLRHLLLDDNRLLAGVIDWGDVQINDPAVDLCVLYTFLPSAAHEAFTAEYGRITDEQKWLAKMRALMYGCNLLDYAQDSADSAMLRESFYMLRNVVTS